MVRVEDDRHIVMLGHQTDMLGAGNGAQDGSLLVRVLVALAWKNTNVRYKTNIASSTKAPATKKVKIIVLPFFCLYRSYNR